MNNILFATVDLAPIDRAAAAAAILAIDDKYSWWDNYRSSKLIPLMFKGGAEHDKINNRKPGEFCWHQCAPQIIIDWFENTVFPWTGSRSRVIALITQPNSSNSEHIDCDPQEVGTRQHKFRIVLQGPTDSLYFKTTSGDIQAPQCTGPFIMDGGWPHGMTNYTDEVKVTIALGSPWNGRDHYTDEVQILQRCGDYTMPSDLTPYYKKG